MNQNRHLPRTPADELSRVLVVDDDPHICALIVECLKREGYGATSVSSARAMDRTIDSEPIDLIILDIMMPGEDGLVACARVAEYGGPPVILLSALGTEDDRVAGLVAGAGHYLSKPCSPRELLATVQAALRSQDRGGKLARQIYAFDGWRLDATTRELLNPEGVRIDLTDGEFAVLRIFVERPRRVLARDSLLEAARGRNCESFDRAIDTQVSRLRRKLGATGDTIIRTIRNEGYFFVPSVTGAS
jgi:two-component system, OmpR family, response regulator